MKGVEKQSVNGIEAIFRWHGGSLPAGAGNTIEIQNRRSSGVNQQQLKQLSESSAVTHPGGDVVVEAVDKVHQFDPQQTHAVDLLMYGLFGFHLL